MPGRGASAPEGGTMRWGASWRLSVCCGAVGQEHGGPCLWAWPRPGEGEAVWSLTRQCALVAYTGETSRCAILI